MRRKINKTWWRAINKLSRLLRPKEAVTRHQQVGEILQNGLKAVEIAEEEQLEIKLGPKSDNGYHRFGNDWWTQPKCPLSFKYLSIDLMYPDAYFIDHGHPNSNISDDIVDYMCDMYSVLFDRKLESVLELGSGGGEITKALASRNLDFVTVEGTKGGVRRLKEIGIPPERIILQNLKFMPRLGRRFDLAMCTEVAEHIEPFFASKIVDNCIFHADAVWFSAADRNRRPNYHHSNELPIEAWDNLFAHMGFPQFVELDGRHGRASRLYLKKGTLPIRNGV